MEREYFVDKLISPPAIEAQAIREVEEFGEEKLFTITDDI